MERLARHTTALALVAFFSMAASSSAAVSQMQSGPDTVLFHHVAIVKMTDSAASITEVVVFSSSGEDASVGVELPLPPGFFDLEIPDSEGWMLEPEGRGIRRVLPLDRGESSVAFSYRLPVVKGTLEFREEVTHYTHRYLFGTRSEEISLSSDILVPMEEPSQVGLKGLRTHGIAPGTVVSVRAALGAPRGANRLLAVLALLVVSGVVLYSTARHARSACQSEQRIERLKQRKESIGALLAKLEEGGKLESDESREVARAYRDRLAATERLLALLDELRKNGTRS